MTDAALARIQGSDDLTIEGRWNYALNMSKAGDLIPKGLWASPSPGQPPQPSPGKIMLVHETGRMLGLHPVAALQGVHIIEGRATISPALMSALVRRDGHRLRVSINGTVEGGDLTAVAELVRVDDPDFTFRSVWTPQRAQRAGLCKYQQTASGQWEVVARSKSGNPLPWEAFTEAMIKARAIGEVCREAAEDSLMGAQYTPEELGAPVNEDGEIVVPAEPSRPWVKDIDAAPDRATLDALLDDLNNSDEYTPELYARIVARMSLMPSEQPPAPREDVYDADGAPVDPDEILTPQTGAQRPSDCPVCGGDHDASEHDA